MYYMFKMFVYDHFKNMFLPFASNEVLKAVYSEVPKVETGGVVCQEPSRNVSRKKGSTILGSEPTQMLSEPSSFSRKHGSSRLLSIML